MIEQTIPLDMKKSSVAIAVDIFRLGNKCTEPLEFPVVQGCYPLRARRSSSVILLGDIDQRNNCLRKMAATETFERFAMRIQKPNHAFEESIGGSSHSKNMLTFQNTGSFFSWPSGNNVSRLDLSYYRASERFDV